MYPALSLALFPALLTYVDARDGPNGLMHCSLNYYYKLPSLIWLQYYNWGESHTIETALPCCVCIGLSFCFCLWPYTNSNSEQLYCQSTVSA